jgi:hypothetical protein
VVLVNVCSPWCIVELKTRFETSITCYDVNGVSLFYFSHLVTLMAYLCSQWTPQVQIKYFIFVWSIDKLFVLNRAWKRVSVQIMIFVYVCSSWGIVKLNTCFVTWTTRKDINGVSLFNLSYLITLMVYMCSERTPNKNQLFHVLLVYVQTICAK